MSGYCKNCGWTACDCVLMQDGSLKTPSSFAPAACSPAPGDKYKFWRNKKRFEVVTVQQNLGPMCEVRWDNGLFGCVDTAELIEANKLENVVREPSRTHDVKQPET